MQLGVIHSLMPDKPIFQMTTQSNHEDLFLKISVWLTGFEAAELQGTGMVAPYYATLVKQSPPQTLDLFFAEVATILAADQQGPEATRAQIRSLLMPASSYGAMAQQIILMWYTGQWFPQPSNAGNSSQISAESYIQALMWPAADTHPPGAKQPGYGSWAEPPIRPSGQTAQAGS